MSFRRILVVVAVTGGLIVAPAMAAQYENVRAEIESHARNYPNSSHLSTGLIYWMLNSCGLLPDAHVADPVGKPAPR